MPIQNFVQRINQADRKQYVYDLSALDSDQIESLLSYYGYPSDIQNPHYTIFAQLLHELSSLCCEVQALTPPLTISYSDDARKIIVVDQEYCSGSAAVMTHSTKRKVMGMSLGPVMLDFDSSSILNIDGQVVFTNFYTVLEAVLSGKGSQEATEDSSDACDIEDRTARQHQDLHVNLDFKLEVSCN
ncbi:hypothetical protein SS50377_24962 [Spironucleus salmonicida]|uniref:Uncharacterized protein n=1 Tax=Spironucleus salmonicida TaxID=348837 RepID=A0A9P8LRR4_9EUKA|nr:hypothetical protein SS50377_24962 [Spironucleus salmonicida]